MGIGLPTLGTRAQVSWQDMAAEPLVLVEGTILNSVLADLQRADSRDELAFCQVPVAHHQLPTSPISQITMLLEVFGDLGSSGRQKKAAW